MKAIRLIAPLLVLFMINLNAQKSVHLFDKIENRESYSKNSGNSKIIYNSSKPLTKYVFGYLPHWEIYDGNIRMDLLTHLSVFDFVLNTDGALTSPYNWPEDWTPIINQAQAAGVKIILTVSNLSLIDTDSLLVSSLINNSSNKRNFFNDIKNIITNYNFDGINIDFENLRLAERGYPINNFMWELRDSLNTWFTGKELSFATPAVNWGERWKLKELSEICDYLFIMAYDYHGSWSENAGPVAPLSGNSQYNLRNYKTTIEIDYADVDPTKLILGVPYYGAQWQTESTNPYTEVGEPNSNWIGSVDYKDIDWIELENDFLFDPISQTPYLLLQTSDEDTLTWIDNYQSLSLKYDFALDKKLGGIGVWSLGKDGNHPELWDLIEEKFTDTTTAVEKEEFAMRFILYQNYPNPFNPNTKISFSLSREGKVMLTVYDALGRNLIELVNETLNAGKYNISFDGSGLSSGIYFYRIDIDNKFREIKKMLLVK